MHSAVEHLGTACEENVGITGEYCIPDPRLLHVIHQSIFARVSDAAADGSDFQKVILHLAAEEANSPIVLFIKIQ